MTNPLTTGREAVWGYLYSDATAAASALKAYIDAGEGTVYRWSAAEGSDGLPTRLTAGDTPALIVVPAAAPPRADGQLCHEQRLGLDITGAVADTDPAEIEQFAWLVHRALYSGFPSLGEDTIRGFHFDALSFAGLGGKRGSPWFRTFTARLVLHLQIDPQE